MRSHRMNHENKSGFISHSDGYIFDSVQFLVGPQESGKSSWNWRSSVETSILLLNKWILFPQRRGMLHVDASVLQDLNIFGRGSTTSETTKASFLPSILRVRLSSNYVHLSVLRIIPYSDRLHVVNWVRILWFDLLCLRKRSLGMSYCSI